MKSETINIKPGDYVKIQTKDRFQLLQESINDVLLSHNFILGKTVSSIYQKVIEISPNKLEVRIEVIPIERIEIIILDIIIE